jgi:tRNA pseudouridine38-40 synthase
MTGTTGDTAPLSPEGGAVASGRPAATPVVPPDPASTEGGAVASGATVLRGTVAYDGTSFRGFAQNEGVRTVAGDLVAAASRVLGVPVTLTVAGRTDAGVHAVGQVVGLQVPAGTEVDAVRLRNSLNGMVGPEVAVTSLEVAPEGFHARFDATWRSYRYRILNSPVHDPFLSATAWWVPDALDLGAMQAAGDLLVGAHDFSSFCRQPKDRRGEPLVRRVTEVRWERADRGGGWDSAPVADGDVVRLAISASAFCHQMVRSVTGTMVDVGRGRLQPQDVARILAAKNRDVAGQVAPPRGLCLWAVGYG